MCFFFFSKNRNNMCVCVCVCVCVFVCVCVGEALTRGSCSLSLLEISVPHPLQIKILISNVLYSQKLSFFPFPWFLAYCPSIITLFHLYTLFLKLVLHIRGFSLNLLWKHLLFEVSVIYAVICKITNKTKISPKHIITVLA